MAADIHTVPVVLAYLMMSEQEVRLYANEADFSEGLKEMLTKAGVALYPYNQVYTDAAAIESQKTVLCR